MSTNKEILESIRQLNAALTETISEAGKNKNSDFFKESIKFSAIAIFEKAQLLSQDNITEIKRTEPEIKIVQPIIEPVVQPEKTIILPEIPPAPIEQKPVQKVEKAQEVVLETKITEVLQSNNNLVKSQLPKDNDLEEDSSLNAKIAKFQQPVINIADKLTDTPIKELVKAISISKKFEFINELFLGKADVYKSCLHDIESSTSYEAATKYIEQNIAETYRWNENEKLAAEFFVLVKRRFL